MTRQIGNHVHRRHSTRDKRRQEGHTIPVIVAVGIISIGSDCWLTIRVSIHTVSQEKHIINPMHRTIVNGQRGIRLIWSITVI